MGLVPRDASDGNRTSVRNNQPITAPMIIESTASIAVDEARTDKRCRCCTEVKGVLEFSRRRDKPDGRANVCRSCDSLRKQASKLLEKVCGASKVCRQCQEEKPPSDFSMSRQSPDGKSPSCKQCDRRRRAEFRAIVKAMPESKVCPLCKSKKPAIEFQSDSSNKDGLYYCCRDCNTIRGILYRSANPGFSRKHTHRHRAAKWSASLRNANPELFDLVETEACDLAHRRESTTGIKWHLDHVVPLRGKLVCGLHVWYNWAVIPAKINIKKGNSYAV